MTNAPNPAEVESKLILDKSFKNNSLEEYHVKGIQPDKMNATLKSAQVHKYITNEDKIC